MGADRRSIEEDAMGGSDPGEVRNPDEERETVQEGTAVKTPDQAGAGSGEETSDSTAVKTPHQQAVAESGQADTSEDSAVQTEPKSTD
jgi:hypothetical protein